MAQMNRCEAEIDAIRDILFERYKYVTPAEYTRHVNEQAEKMAAQYGFKIGRPSDKRERELIAK